MEIKTILTLRGTYTPRKVSPKSEKGGWKLGERRHLSLKFSREFGGLQAVKSEFRLSKLRVWAKESQSFMAGKSEFHGRKVGVSWQESPRPL